MATVMTEDQTTAALIHRLREQIVAIDHAGVQETTKAALGAGVSAQRIIAEGLGPGMEAVGKKFEEGDYFVPELLLSARAMGQALDLLRQVGSSAGVAEASLGLGRCLVEREELEAAVPLLETAERLTAELVLGDNGALPSAWLALLGKRDPAAVEVGETSPVPVRAEAHAVLHRAGGGSGHLESAQELLEQMSSHLSETERERFWKLNPTARLVNACARPDV